MAEPYKIYTLHDPDTMAVRYVGFTSKTLKKRLSGHIADSKAKLLQDHRSCWIRSLLNCGERPAILLVETVSEENWQDRERFWISHFRETGCRLTNSCDGGDGAINPSDETRAKMRAAKLGKPLSLEHRAKLSAVGRGRPISKEHKEKLRASRLGKSHSKESREKIGAAHRGKTISEEHKAKLLAAHLGKTRSAQHLANMSAARTKPVVEISTGRVFASTKEAALFFGVIRQSVAYWIKIGKFAYANNQLKGVIMK